MASNCQPRRSRAQQTPHVMSRLEQCVGGKPRFRVAIGKMRFPLLLLAAVWLPLCPAQTVPTPESVLGHKPGDDFYLANYQESRDYFRRLAAASNRIKLITVGKTTRGLDWEIAIISSPANLAALDRNKQISQRLAHGYREHRAGQRRARRKRRQ